MDQDHDSPEKKSAKPKLSAYDQAAKLLGGRAHFRRQLFVDSMVFRDSALRQLSAEVGVDQIEYGTDYPFDWPVGIDVVLNAPSLSDTDKAAILGGNASRLLRI